MITTGAPPPSKRLRLESIDSLRALAALAVVVVHSFEIFGLGLPDVGNPTGGLQEGVLAHTIIFTLFDWIFRLGGIAVPVFIVLSGYSLMIPVARSPQTLRTAKQLGVFFYRRARRIVPPFYAAMVFSLLIIALVPGMGTINGVYWDRAIRDLDAMNIVAHLLLIHNLNDAWINAINPPFWSLAVEWQIYFLFPLMVILWRRLGLLVLLVTTAVYGISGLYLDVLLLPFTHTHFVLLFAMGMGGAAISFGAGSFESQLRDRLPWGWLTALGFLAYTANHLGKQALGLPLPDSWIPEIIMGAAIVALTVHTTKSQLDGVDSAADRALSHPVLTSMGAFSYSLYLVHMPILAMLAVLTRSLALSTTASYMVIFMVGIPLSIVVSYGFHVIFERPFMNMPSPAAKAAKAAAS
jgi:peptidoglycan/LPS O-acetylase OafA/YrhL